MKLRTDKSSARELLSLAKLSLIAEPKAQFLHNLNQVAVGPKFSTAPISPILPKTFTKEKCKKKLDKPQTGTSEDLNPK
jgi:hypothetical protein